MDITPLLGQLVVVFGAAVVVVLLLDRIRFPTIAGLVVAGAIIGPSGVGWVTDPHRIEAMAEIGVALLLFTIGLEFSLEHLRRIGRYIALGGSLQVGLTLLACVAIAALAGATVASGLFLGFLVALSSTAIVLRALDERGETDAPHGRVILGVLLFQDLCVVPMMLLTPLLAGAGSGLGAIALALLKAAAVVVGTLFLGRIAIPRVLGLVAATRKRDVFVLAVLLIGAGVAWLTSLVGLSLALGAFLAGLALADSEYGNQALADVLPLRDILSSLFFVSIGMLLDASVIVESPVAVGAGVLAVLVGKASIVGLASMVMRFPIRVAVLAGTALAQIGEFSFVLARLGADVGLLAAAHGRLFVAASVITMTLTPLLVRMGPHLAAGAARLRGIEGVLGLRPTPERPGQAGTRDHVVVLGYGLGGQLLVEALGDAEIPCVAVDIAVERVRASRERGEPVRYGDVTSEEILERVGVATARSVVVLLNDPDATRRAVQTVRRISPTVPLTVRTRYLAEIASLEKAGADDVVAQEFEASLEVIARVLRRSDMPRNVIDDRVEHARLRGTPVVRAVTMPRRKLGEIRDLSELKVESVLVRESAWVDGRSIAESELRKRTGATLIAISRGGEVGTHVQPNERIRAADVLYLVGNRDQVRAAIALVESGPGDDEDGAAGGPAESAR
ncbi:cation:proton antiporter [Myxococcota bacterium]|nr:cation:proton antiporter [Myxococcota bacterium]